MYSETPHSSKACSSSDVVGLPAADTQMYTAPEPPLSGCPSVETIVTLRDSHRHGGDIGKVYKSVAKPKHIMFYILYCSWLLLF